MYVLLKWLYEHKKDYDDPLNVVEIIYDDFSFPDSIASFVRYAPMKEPDLGSVEKNTARLFLHWEHFLKEQQQKWKKNLLQ